MKHPKITRPYLNRWLTNHLVSLGFLDYKVVHSYKTRLHPEQYHAGAACYIFTVNGKKMEGLTIFCFSYLWEIQEAIDKGEKLILVQKSRFGLTDSYITTKKP